MPTRSTTTAITFQAPFKLSSVEGEQPAGTYWIETDEEQIEGLSFNAFHRTLTTLFLPADPKPGMTRQSVQVDPQELAQALAADAAVAGTQPNHNNHKEAP
jgi:hypothetical protein